MLAQALEVRLHERHMKSRKRLPTAARPRSVAMWLYIDFMEELLEAVTNVGIALMEMQILH